MRKAKEIAGRKCPECGSTENQVSNGHNPCGTQKCKCNKCGKYYTLNPKTKAYSEEVRESAIRIFFSGMSARQVGHVLNMSKANVLNWIKKNEGDNLQ